MTLLLIIAGWLLIGWLWGFVMVNRCIFQKYLEEHYWRIAYEMLLNQYRQWVQMHPGITADSYHDSKWKELYQEVILSPKAQEGREVFVRIVSRAVILHSTLFGPITILMDLKDKLFQRRLPSSTKTTL